MKRILISAVMVLALAGTSVFAAQNKNAGGKKPAATKTTNTAMASNTGGTKGKTRRHRKGKGKGSANKNAGSSSMTKTKPKNSK